jgi:hypothetical protein
MAFQGVMPCSTGLALPEIVWLLSRIRCVKRVYGNCYEGGKGNMPQRSVFGKVVCVSAGPYGALMPEHLIQLF